MIVLAHDERGALRALAPDSQISHAPVLGGIALQFLFFKAVTEKRSREHSNTPLQAQQRVFSGKFEGCMTRTEVESSRALSHNFLSYMALWVLGVLSRVVSME